ncbi:hypothetical protein Bca4012_024133 [Brassica carinata]
MTSCRYEALFLVVLVSKSWARIISSRDFIRSFPTGSCSSQPRFLVCFIGRTRPWNNRQYCYFVSSSSSSTTFPSRVKSPVKNPEFFPFRSHYANGLIRLGYGKNILIWNPSTGKFITLPNVRFSKSFFGYDPVSDHYKILLKTINRPNGANWSQRSLVKFNLRYEKLDFVTSLSADMRIDLCGYSLINYMGKVAIPSNVSRNAFNVWVIDQAADPKHGWLKKSFSIDETWESLSNLRIYGYTHTGEFVVAPKYYSDDFSVTLFNPNTNGLRKIKVDVNGDYEFKHGHNRSRAMVYSEYVESIRLL